jgi:hypothetical protein
MRRRYERLVDSIASQASFQATPPRAEFLQYLRTSSRPGAPPPPPIDVRLTTSSTDTDFSPPELSARQYALMLLHVASQIEHALMVQYLYAAYSLGGSHRVARTPPAEEWRTVLLDREGGKWDTSGRSRTSSAFLAAPRRSNATTIPFTHRFTRSTLSSNR